MARLGTRLTPRVRLAAVVLAALAALVCLSTLLPLADPDEGRNAEIAREVARSGDWVVPCLSGMPYADKPPGLFWAAAGAIRLFGTNPQAARLPSVLAAAGCLWLVGLLALHLRGTIHPLSPVLLLLSAPLFLGLSTFVIFDMPLTLCVTLLWTLLARELASGPTTAGRAGLFLALGAGLLFKGPVMLAWAVGGCLFASALMRSTAPLIWLASWRGWGGVLLVVGGWFAAACREVPEYPRYALLVETVERLTTDSFHRGQPVWFIPAVLLAGALPWSLATPWTRRAGGASRLAAGFVLFALAFFSFSSSQLATYPLPAVPALAWIAAEAWSDRNRIRRGACGLALCYLLLAGAIVAVPHVAQARGHRPADVLAGVDGPAGQLAAAGLVALAGAAMIAARRRSETLALGTLPVFGAVALVCFTPAAAIESGAPLATAIRREDPDAAVRFERCWSPGVDFLLDRRSTIVSPHGHETTSTYIDRYDTELRGRGEWTLLSERPEPDPASVVVLKNEPGAAEPCPDGFREFFRDRRFLACARTDRSARAR